MLRTAFSRTGPFVVVALLALLLLPAAVLAKKPAPPPPPPEPDPDPAIAYVQSVRQGKTLVTRLYVMNDDGTNRTEIRPIAANPATRLDWSPDGTKLLFTGWKDDLPVIYAIGLNDSDPTVVTTLNVTPVFGPAWSPATEGGTADRIVFADRTPGGLHDLYMVKSDGTGLVQLTDTPTLSERHPTWSPSGRKIACVVYDSEEPARQDLWGLYDFDGADGPVYTVDHHDGELAGASVSCPTWSKTREDRIAWAVFDGDQHDIWIVDIDGDDLGFPLQVTDSSDARERLFSWSPDDARFVVATESTGRKGGTNLETIDADGSNRTLLLENATRPCWKR